MKAALVPSLDGPDAIVLADIPTPTPKAGEAVVRVSAAALNFLDTLMVRGRYQEKPELPFSPAGEFSGVVEAVAADVTTVKLGDRVCGYGTGAAREKVATDARLLVPVPAGVSDEAAAGVTVTYGTAYHGLKDRGALKAGETVAVLGASGGAGLAAVEIAKLMGARVIAVASSDEKLAACKAAGADVLFNYVTTPLRDGLKALAPKGIDVVYDCVGGPHAEPAIRSLAWGGRYLVVGFAAGDIPRIALNLLLLKSSSLVGVFWGAHVRRDLAGHGANMRQILQWVAEGKLKPHVGEVFPLAKTADAIRLLDARRSIGKVLIKP
jgi:NADPH:quinone reductase